MKVALVTGSTQGIGLLTARKLYDDGCSIVMNSPNEADGRVIGGFEDQSRVRFFAGDVSKTKQLDEMAEFVKSELGKLDYLVCNAGVTPLPCGIDDITGENTDKTIDVNLKGTFNTLKVLGGLVQETSKSGSIVCVTSVDGIIGEPYGVIYSATKAGIISFVKSFARKFGDPLVRVNAVAPGLIDTPLTASTGEEPNWTTDVSIIKRMGRPDEIAAAISFLLSDQASFITGQTLVVDGGFTLK